MKFIRTYNISINSIGMNWSLIDPNLWNLDIISNKTSKQHKYYSEKFSN